MLFVLYYALSYLPATYYLSSFPLAISLATIFPPLQPQKVQVQEQECICRLEAPRSLPLGNRYEAFSWPDTRPAPLAKRLSPSHFSPTAVAAAAAAAANDGTNHDASPIATLKRASCSAARAICSSGVTLARRRFFLASTAFRASPEATSLSEVERTGQSLDSTAKGGSKTIT